MSELSPESPLPHNLVAHWDDLLRLARCQFPVWLRPHLDPIDLVQQTLAEAIRANDRLTGRPAHEIRGYLLRSLTNNLIDAVRRHTPERTDVSPGALAESSVRMADWMIADNTSPSIRAERNERFARLADAMAGLPEAQRLAVQMRYFLGMRVTEIADVLGGSGNAVSQLLFRALANLRDTLNESNG